MDYTPLTDIYLQDPRLDMPEDVRQAKATVRDLERRWIEITDAIYDETDEQRRYELCEKADELCRLLCEAEKHAGDLRLRWELGF